MLRELNEVPDGLLEAEAHQLEALLGAPTLIHLPGRRQPALFVSVLMHGNETVGWDAVRQLLARHRQDGGGWDLPRSLSLFLGNLSAAALNLRRLPDQPDYNRVWPSGEVPDSPERRLMRQIWAIMAERGLFASIDVHNNTGINPHYSCVTELDQRFLRLATLFSRTVVYIRQPRGTQAMAMADLCPSVTLECGKVGQHQGMRHAVDYLSACLHLADIPSHPVAPQDLDLYHTLAQVKVRPDRSLATGAGDADLVLPRDLDHLNFRELPPGTSFGAARSGRGLPVEAKDAQDQEVTAQLFEVAAGHLRLRQPLMPAMLTLDERIIRQDCLCYLMERYNHRIPH